jgi:hypothetical protein
VSSQDIRKYGISMEFTHEMNPKIKNIPAKIAIEI